MQAEYTQTHEMRQERSIAGFVMLQRGWARGLRLKAGPFTEEQALRWMIEEACWAPCTRYGIVRHRRTPIQLVRGQLLGSSGRLAAAWRWPYRTKVDRFLARLEDNGLISVSTEAGIRVITIRAYDRLTCREGRAAGAHRAALSETLSPGLSPWKKDEIANGRSVADAHRVAQLELNVREEEIKTLRPSVLGSARSDEGGSTEAEKKGVAAEPAEPPAPAAPPMETPEPPARPPPLGESEPSLESTASTDSTASTESQPKPRKRRGLQRTLLQQAILDLYKRWLERVNDAKAPEERSQDPLRNLHSEVGLLARIKGEMALLAVLEGLGGDIQGKLFPYVQAMLLGAPEPVAQQPRAKRLSIAPWLKSRDLPLEKDGCGNMRPVLRITNRNGSPWGGVFIDEALNDIRVAARLPENWTGDWDLVIDWCAEWVRRHNDKSVIDAHEAIIKAIRNNVEWASAKNIYPGDGLVSLTWFNRSVGFTGEFVDETLDPKARTEAIARKGAEDLAVWKAKEAERRRKEAADEAEKKRLQAEWQERKFGGEMKPLWDEIYALTAEDDSLISGVKRTPWLAKEHDAPEILKAVREWYAAVGSARAAGLIMQPDWFYGVKMLLRGDKLPKPIRPNFRKLPAWLKSQADDLDAELPF